jgi:hypothetical protein
MNERSDSKDLTIGAERGTRTPTGLSALRILSPLRLPVPPSRRPGFSIAQAVPSQPASAGKPLHEIWIFGAGDGDRTRDVQLGKLAFYH